MRCDEVVRELAAPTADRDRAEMADHLAGCPACADWARRAEALDRLWGATCPAEPSPETWDAIWSNIAQALPSPASVRAEDPPGVGMVPSRNGSGAKLLVHPGPAPAPVPDGPRSRGRARRFAAVALVVLAQAAAILVALGLAWRTQPRPDGPRHIRQLAGVQNPPAAAVAVRWEKPVDYKADIEGSCMMVIRINQKSGRVEDVTPPEMNIGSDIGMEITNVMEGIATPVMAAQ